MPTWIKIELKIRPASLQEMTVKKSLTTGFLRLSTNKNNNFSIKAKWNYRTESFPTVALSRLHQSILQDTKTQKMTIQDSSKTSESNDNK